MMTIVHFTATIVLLVAALICAAAFGDAHRQHKTEDQRREIWVESLLWLWLSAACALGSYILTVLA